MDRDHFVRNGDRLAHAHRRELDFARALERPIFDEGLGQRLAHHDGAVVFEHQNALVAEVLAEALAFLLANRPALDIMVGELTEFGTTSRWAKSGQYVSI